MVPTHIGKRIIGPDGSSFAIVEFIGRGAFGEVYRARCESSRQDVAVKLLPTGRLVDPLQRKALLNEIRAAQGIVHPNVVRVLFVDDGADPDLGPFACMEYVPGGTLDDLLRRHVDTKTQFSLPEAVRLMSGVAEGARAINERLVHRDIKPDNILMDRDVPKIGDFGISKFINESTRLGTFKGIQHLAYKAPEGWLNEANTFKLDVYAVGIIFFEVVALRHPLAHAVRDSGSASEWEKAHLYEICPDPRTLRDDLSMPLAQLVTRMVAKRPQDRPNWDEVQSVLQGHAATGAPEGIPAISQAVAAAVAKQREQEKRDLDSKRSENERQTQLRLYQYSCETLMKSFEIPVDQFNREFQSGNIKIDKHWAATRYVLPRGNAIEVSFFEPNPTGIKITAGLVVGGGWIGLGSGGRSANLVLLREGADDLYGRWVICEVRLMALVDPSKIVGRFGLTRETVEPFGFKDAYFYDQIRYASGIMHAFTYHFRNDVQGYFAELMLEGCQ